MQRGVSNATFFSPPLCVRVFVSQMDVPVQCVMDDLEYFPAGSSLIPLSKNTPDAVCSIHVNAHGFVPLICPLRRGRLIYELLQYK